MRAPMVRAYVEHLLEELTGVPKAKPGPDGDYSVKIGASLFTVHLIGDTNPVVQVLAAAAGGVAVSPALHERLNEINTSVRFARIFVVRDQVLVVSDLVGATIDPEEFGHACKAVATIAGHFGPRLAEEFGGTASFEQEKAKATPDGAGPADPGTGLYL